MDWVSIHKELPKLGNKVEVVIEQRNYQTNDRMKILATGSFDPKYGWEVFNYAVDHHSFCGVLYWREVDAKTDKIVQHFEPQPEGGLVQYSSPTNVSQPSTSKLWSASEPLSQSSPAPR